MNQTTRLFTPAKLYLRGMFTRGSFEAKYKVLETNFIDSFLVKLSNKTCTGADKRDIRDDRGSLLLVT